MVNQRGWVPDTIPRSPEGAEWISLSMIRHETKYPWDFLKSHINLLFQIPFLKVNMFPCFSFSSSFFPLSQ